jgi:RsiW-degrading membrane proteinase PrsW (M82 family)
MFFTGNPNLYPTVILIGNFLVPVVFVAFLYDHQHISSITTGMLAQALVLGGMLGVLGASILEPLLLSAASNPDQGLTLGTGVMIGLIEEGCKGLALIWVARKTRHDSEVDGLLLGAAVGMGFAALESTGYAFTAFLTQQGAVAASIIETVLRGLLAPFGHGVWTGIFGAMLFRESTVTRFRFNVPVLLAYFFVSILHGLWDGWPRTIYFVVPPGFAISVASVTISLIGIVVLVLLFRDAVTRRFRSGAA